jgi:hypothetical protein
MSKLNHLNDYEDITAVFNGVLAVTALERNVRIKILGDEKLKKIGVVSKASPREQFMSNYDVFITINQTVMEQLDIRQQILVAEELIAEIVFDSEKDRITIKKPDYATFSGIATKYGHTLVEETKQLIKEIYSQENDK